MKPPDLAVSIGVQDCVRERFRDGQPDLVEPLTGGARSGSDGRQRATSQRHGLRDGRVRLVQSVATAHLDWSDTQMSRMSFAENSRESVQGGRQPAPSVPCQRVADAQLVEHADDHASHVVARPVGARERLEEQIEATLLLAGV